MIAYAALLLTVAWLAGLGGYWLAKRRAAQRAPCRRVSGERMHLNDLVAVIGEWQARTFPTSTPQSVLAHLRKELRELEADPSNGEELADCIMLLFALATKANLDLSAEIAHKFRINCERSWGAVNVEGFVEHIRE